MVILAGHTALAARRNDVNFNFSFSHSHLGNRHNLKAKVKKERKE